MYVPMCERVGYIDIDRRGVASPAILAATGVTGTFDPSEKRIKEASKRHTTATFAYNGGHDVAVRLNSPLLLCLYCNYLCTSSLRLFFSYIAYQLLFRNLKARVILPERRRSTLGATLLSPLHYNNNLLVRACCILYILYSVICVSTENKEQGNG